MPCHLEHVELEHALPEQPPRASATLRRCSCAVPQPAGELQPAQALHGHRHWLGPGYDIYIYIYIYIYVCVVGCV